jgi:hypothetical protein
MSNLYCLQLCILYITGSAASSAAAAAAATITTTPHTVITTFSISGKTYYLKAYIFHNKSARHNIKISYRWHVYNC